ncbi:MAG TPA: ABC transporter permease [Thermoplasmata archaeon]
MAAPIVGTRAAVREALRMKSGMFGFGMLLFMMVVVVAVPIIAPYDTVRAWADVSVWTDNPRVAAPDWIDSFSEKKQARTILVEWDEFSIAQSNTSQVLKIALLRARWDFTYDTFPQELRLQMLSTWSGRKPLITVDWRRPDGQSLTIYSASPDRLAPHVETLSLSDRVDVQTNVRNWALGLGADDVASPRPHVGLYAVQDTGMLHLARANVLKGQYTLTVQAIMFNATDTVLARFTSYGTVFGLAGTDHFRRDLLVGLLWGAPVALAFGAAAAGMTVMSQVILGALGAYYGGRFDEFIQRSTDFVIILPALPILVLIGTLYQPGILTVLFIVVLFNIVGGTTKVVRSIALQTKEELYIEAARSYGASRRRILFRYIMPRTMPYTFALLALSVPSFIFLEASLSFLGLGDPVLPTWGAIMGEASRNGAVYNGIWWWIAFPAFGIVFATVAFAFLGYSFDKVLNPRLREE